MKQKAVYILWGVLVIIALQSSVQVYGVQVQSVQTEGSIGFTGNYKPIGTPDPIPSENIISPENNVPASESFLPQTNTVTNCWMTWLGTAILIFSFVFWKGNKRHTYKLK